VLVDDAHWADSTSLGVLAHIANRLDGVRVALLVASRSEEALEPLDVLRRQAEAHGTLLHVQPLGAEAAAIVVRSFAPSADDALCRKVHVATGGNPFLLAELSRTTMTGGPVTEQSPERVRRSYTRFIESSTGVFFRLIRMYYHHSFRELFLTGQGPLEVHRAAMSILAGHVYPRPAWPLRWRFWLLSFFIRVNRYFPIAPRRPRFSLVSPPAPPEPAGSQR